MTRIKRLIYRPLLGSSVALVVAYFLWRWVSEHGDTQVANAAAVVFGLAGIIVPFVIFHLTSARTEALSYVEAKTRELLALNKNLREERDRVVEYQSLLLEAQSMSKIGSWSMDLRTNVLIWTTEHYRIFEIEEPQSGSSLYQLYRSRIHPDDLPELDRIVTKASTFGGEYVFDHRIVLDGGKRIKYVQGRGRVLVEADGRPKYMSGTCQDVTERVTREAEYRMSLDALGIGVWKFNPITQQMIWDDSMFKLYEMDKADFQGDYQAWLNSLTPEARVRAIEENERYLSGSQQFSSTLEIHTKSGKRKFIGRIGNVVRNHKGEPIMVYGVNWDRTREFEAELQISKQKALVESVLANMPDMVFVKDMKNDLRFTLMNKAGEKLIGISNDEFFGKNDYDFHPKEVADYFTSKDREAFVKGTPLTIEKEPIQTKTGIRFLRTYKVPLFDQNGQPDQLMGISRDITEELKMQEQLEVERAKSIHTAKLASLGEMSAGVAHEINNPLAIIDGNLRLLTKFVDQPEKFAAKIEAMLKSTTRISRIVNGLRTFARESSSSERVEIPLSKILEEVLVLVEVKAKRHGVQLEIKSDSLDEISCDVVEIEQVFINLINNGIDAVKDLEERWVKVHCFKSEATLVVRVIDSGAGLSKEVEEKVFQPFFTTKQVGEGTGLGLPITKGILDQHMATIFVNRSLENTCFEVRFPIAREVTNVA